jgi:hypothetical protein
MSLRWKEIKNLGEEPSQPATKEPITHILVPVGRSLPIPVNARTFRQNQVEHPNDKTRPGEVKTQPPEV